MSQKNKQGVENVSGSVVNQAGGNITITNTTGVSAVEVVQICNDVVRTQMAVYTEIAKSTAQNNLNLFCNSFTKRLEDVEDKVRSQLKEPAVQIALRDSINGSIECNDDQVTEEMVDLMIERMETPARCAKQFVITEAIQLLPKINKAHLAFLALAVFLKLKFTRDRAKFKKVLFSDISPALKLMNDFHLLDLNYLEQIGCLGNPRMLLRSKSVEAILIEGHKLFFAKKLEAEKYLRLENAYVMNDSDRESASIIFYGNSDEGYSCLFTTSDITDQLTPNLKTMVETFDKECEAITEQECREYLIQGNPAWENVIDFMNSKAKAVNLTPVGEYLGLRMLSRMLSESITLDIFYSNK